MTSKFLLPAILVGCFLAACAAPAPPGSATATLPPAQVTSLPGTQQLLASPTPSPQPTLTPSPTPDNAPDLSGETIVLVHLCDRTGPFASAHASRVRAVEDAVAALNAAGGIFGARLDLRLADTAGTEDGAQQALARMIRQNGEGPLVLICDPATEAALLDSLNEDEIPALGPGLFGDPRGYLFGVDAIPQDHFAFFLEELNSRWRQLRPEGAPDEMRVALLAWPAEQAGDLAAEAALADLEFDSVSLVLQADMGMDEATDVFELIYLARDANANVIYTNARGRGLAELLNALHDLGLRQRFVVGAPALAFDVQVYEYLHEATRAQDVLLTSAWAWWGEQQDGISGLLQLQPAAEFHDWGYIQMAGAVSIARRALEVAILADGIEGLSPESVLDALVELENYPVSGGLFTADYTGGQRSLHGLRLWQMGTGLWDQRLP